MLVSTSVFSKNISQNLIIRNVKLTKNMIQSVELFSSMLRLTEVGLRNQSFLEIQDMDQLSCHIS